MNKYIQVSISSLQVYLYTNFFIINVPVEEVHNRGAVVECLDRLGYGAESRRKVVSSRLCFAMR